MKLRMELNGVDVSQYKLTPLDGNLNTLMKPAADKNLVKNENSSMNGTLILHSPTVRKVASRDITLSFKITTPSLVDLQREIDKLVNLLKMGKDSTGMNELYVPIIDTTYRLVYISMDKYSNFGLCGKATLSIKFTETDPTNRQK